MQKVAIGVPFYGPQDSAFWTSLVGNAVALQAQGIAYGGLLVCGVSTADINRNKIVTAFLKGDADWLFWMDADNPAPIGAIPRLLATATDKKIVSGLYYGGKMETPFPIAYLRKPEGTYTPFSDVIAWERGEIFEVDAVGMGCCLVHRQVFLDIKENMVVLQRLYGGLTLVHRQNIHSLGVGNRPHPYQGVVRQGIFYDPVMEVTLTDPDYPFFACQFGRTEDMWFCEVARAVGHHIWLDTSVEATHVKPYEYSGADFRRVAHLSTDPDIIEVEYAV